MDNDFGLATSRIRGLREGNPDIPEYLPVRHDQLHQLLTTGHHYRRLRP